MLPQKKNTILRTIISKAGLPDNEYLDFFQKSGISDASLETLGLEQVEDLLNDHGPLVKCSFYNALSLWQRELSKDITDPMPMGFKPFKKQHFDIQAILLQDMAGQHAIDYYKKHGKIEQYCRTKIIHVVVDYFLRTKMWVEKQNFTYVTEKIVEYFKTDNPKDDVSMVI